MVDSSEKVLFRVDMQCSSLRAEAFLVFDRGSHPTLGQQITDMLPTVGRQSADCWQKIFVKGGKRKTVGGLLANCRPTVGQLLANSQPTVDQQSAHSFLGELFFTFSELTVFIKYVEKGHIFAHNYYYR